MAKCCRCGNSGLFLKLNALGLCSDCEIAELSELRIQNREQAQKIYQLTQRIAELKDQYNKAIANQKNNKVNESYPSSSNQTRYSSAVAMGSVSAHEANFCDEVEKLKQRYIAFDVETTGLNPYTNKIIEVGAVLFENGKLVKEFGTLVNANCDVPRSASSINHITGDMIRNAPSESEVYSKLIDFLGDALNEQTIICAHNAKFDMDFLSQTLMRLGYNGKIVYIDTLRTARSVVKGLPDYKQPTLAKHFMIENEQVHRATADAKVCGQILIKLVALNNQKSKEILYSPNTPESFTECDFSNEIVTTLSSGSKLAQSNINKCKFGDVLSFAYNPNNKKYEIFSSYGLVGFITQAKEYDFKFNIPQINIIKVEAISYVKNNQKSLCIKIILNSKVKRHISNKLEIISNKAITQQNIMNISIGENVIFKLNQTQKYICYLKSNPNVELGYVPQKALYILKGALSFPNYEAFIVDILQKDEKKAIIIKIDYGI